MTKEMGEYSRATVAALVSTMYPRYNRDNFTVWATTMEWALESNELWEPVDPGGDEYKKGKSKYRKDRRALTAIRSVMPMDVMQHLISKKSAKEAWDTLMILNLGHTRMHEATLQTFQKKFENLEVEEDETLDAFASRVATIVNGIRELDEKLEEISVVRRFLRAAPARYISVVSVIEQCVDLKTVTLDNLVEWFKAHDERMKITYGDAKMEEHIMLTHAQWQAIDAREKNDGASGSGGK
jgi:DNA polymerase I-like protein with 3'-5' exonuclease and polymerase domains